MAQRESRYVTVARIAYRIAREALPTYSHPKSPHHYTFPQLAACVLLTFYLDLGYRDMEEWLLASDRICRALELEEVPDHSTLNRAFQRLRMSDFRRMERRLLDEADPEETLVASDATGYRPTQASPYYRTRQGGWYRDWVKGVYAVGTDSQLILAQRQGRGPGSDTGFLPGLRRDARCYGGYDGRFRDWTMLADAGFDGRGVEPGDLIPPVRRSGHMADPRRQARAEQVDAARLDGIYGQRWICETVHSVIKRKFGDTVRSRKFRFQQREPAVKGLIYNIHR